MKIKFELNGHRTEIDENPRKKLSEFSFVVCSVKA